MEIGTKKISWAFGVTLAFAMGAIEAVRAGEPVVATRKVRPAEKKETTLLSFRDGKIVFDIEERVRGEIPRK